MHGHDKLNVTFPTFWWYAVGENHSDPLSCTFFLLTVGHFDVCNCIDLFKNSKTPLLFFPSRLTPRKQWWGSLPGAFENSFYFLSQWHPPETVMHRMIVKLCLCCRARQVPSSAAPLSYLEEPPTWGQVHSPVTFKFKCQAIQKKAVWIRQLQSHLLNWGLCHLQNNLCRIFCTQHKVIHLFPSSFSRTSWPQDFGTSQRQHVSEEGRSTQMQGDFL